MTDDTREIRPEDLPDIPTEWGTVDKRAQWQAGVNMRLNHSLRDKVVAGIGEAEARRRYPHAFEDQDSK